jgi:hypothetical protein
MSGPYYRQFRHQFGRGYYRPQRIGPVPAAAIGAVVVLAAIGTATRDHARPGPAAATAGHGHAGPGAPASPAAVTAAMAPPPGGVTLASFPQAVLSGLGDRTTPCAIAGIRGWIRAEGSNPAWANPLDSTLPEPGSHRVNITSPGHGVQAYVSWDQGTAATLATLHNGLYGPILTALRTGSAQDIANTVALSLWGTGRFTVTCRGT